MPALRQARAELCEAELIAYRKPLYQLLDLSSLVTMDRNTTRSGRGEAVVIGDILRGIASGGAQ